MSLISYASDIFDVWQLQNGSYNGVNFYVVPSILGLDVAGIPGATEGLQIYEDIAGTINNSGLTLADNSQYLPKGLTRMILKEGTEQVSNKIAIHNSIGSSVNYIEHLGNGVETFSFTAFFTGENYLDVYHNAREAFLIYPDKTNYNKIAETNRFLLNHPIRGEIPNCYVKDVNAIYSWRARKAILINVTMVANVTPVFNGSDKKISNFSQIVNATTTIINDISLLVQMINSILATMQGLFDTLNTYDVDNMFGIPTPILGTSSDSPTGSNLINQTYLKTNNIQALEDIVNKCQYATVTIFNQNKVYTDSRLANYNTTTDLNPIIINNINIDTTDYILDDLQLTIDNLPSGKIKEQSNSILTSIQKLSDINNIIYYEYYVPFLMDIREVLFQNNLPLDNLTLIKQILAMNNLYSSNLIPKGLYLRIPRL